jgi:hypothetical protein
MWDARRWLRHPRQEESFHVIHFSTLIEYIHEDNIRFL